MIAAMTSPKLGRALAVAAVLVPCSVATVAKAEIPYVDVLTPGELRGIARTDGDPWPLGYWEYLPSNFDELGDDELLPLLVFLPGIGEYDDVSSCPGNVDVCAASDCGNDGLCRNLSWGPQQLMRTNNWDDTLRPFIMISPQNDVPPFSQIQWDYDQLDDFFDFVVAEYPIDPRRMYLTGMSQGGRAVFQYTDLNPRRFTAVAPLPGGQVQGGVTCGFEDTALWVFHGANDNNGNLGPGVFNPCVVVDYTAIYNDPATYPQYPACVAAVGQPRPVGRITMFFNVGHSSWVQAINPIGSGFPATEWPSDQGCGFDNLAFRDYSAASDPDGLYSWFLALDRPDVTASADVEVPGDGSEVEVFATTIDDDAITYTWTQIAGPAATLDGADGATVTVSDLMPLTAYTFEVLAVDADDQWDRDQVIVTVLEAPAGGSSTTDATTTDATTTDATTTDATTTDATTTDATTTDATTTNATTTDSTTEGTSSDGTSTDSTTGPDTGSGGSETSGSGTTVGMTSVGESAGTSAADTSASDTSASDTSTPDTSASEPSGGPDSNSASATDPDATATASASGGTDEGSSGGGVPLGEDNPGCGCTSPGSDGPGRTAPWMLGLAVVMLRRRRL